MKRITATASGYVQAVGFRDHVLRSAKEHNISGSVRNLKSGEVEVIAEGEEKNLKLFLDAINIRKNPIYVDKLDIIQEAATGEYKYFTIVRGDWKDELFERLDTAGQLLYRSVELGEASVELGKRNLILSERAVTASEESLADGKKMLDKQDQMLDKQDQTIEIIKETKEEVTGLRKDAGKYLEGEFSEIKKEIASIKAPRQTSKSES